MWYPPFHLLAVMVWPTLMSTAGAGAEGRWETIDDRTGVRRAAVQVSEGRP